jgi:DNA-binding response OmpR family regulator
MPDRLVCVIDDDARLRQALCAVLQAAGFRTIEAEDGEIGLQRAKAEKPAIALVDIVMPNREGIETIQLLKEAFPQMPVVAMSGHHTAGKEYLTWAKEIGADDCLAKPFAPSLLIDCINRLLTNT